MVLPHRSSPMLHQEMEQRSIFHKLLLELMQLMRTSTCYISLQTSPIQTQHSSSSSSHNRQTQTCTIFPTHCQQQEHTHLQLYQMTQVMGEQSSEDSLLSTSTSPRSSTSHRSLLGTLA